MKLHVIYTESEVFVSRKAYSSWLEIQSDYSDYKASLGPWSAEDVESFLADEYDDLYPPASVQIDKFVTSASEATAIQFRKNG